MRITQSDISLNSQRSFLKGTKETTSLRVVDGNREFRASSTKESLVAESSDESNRVVQVSRRGRNEPLSEVQGPPFGFSDNGRGLAMGRLDLAPGQIEGAEMPAAEDLDPKMQLTKMLMEKVFGKKVSITAMKFEMSSSVETFSSALGASNTSDNVGSAPQPRAFGLAYDHVVTRSESENTQFAAQGQVITADGKSISFQLSLNMSREFSSQESTSLRIGTLKDPLVINFNGGAAELADARFAFDLDSDGTQEQVHFLQQGSAFLAFDKNGDGTINDGSELFGTKSGDGFADLAAYDQDGNQFIDEGDEIFSKLTLYNKNAYGQDELTKLSDAGVGAIYLKRTETEFSVNNPSDNSQKGQIRSTGIWLGEEGQIGTVQQVDLVQIQPESATMNAEIPIDATDTAPEQSPVLDISA